MKKILAGGALLAAGILIAFGQGISRKIRVVTRATERIARGTKIMEYRPLEKTFLLVHDGKKVLAFHGTGAVTGSGNPKAIFLVGTKKQLEAEIVRLKLDTGVKKETVK